MLLMVKEDELHGGLWFAWQQLFQLSSDFKRSRVVELVDRDTGRDEWQLFWSRDYRGLLEGEVEKEILFLRREK